MWKLGIIKKCESFTWFDQRKVWAPNKHLLPNRCLGQEPRVLVRKGLVKTLVNYATKRERDCYLKMEL